MSQDTMQKVKRYSEEYCYMLSNVTKPMLQGIKNAAILEYQSTITRKMHKYDYE